MTPENFKQMLLDWQRWFFHDHSLRGLGIAQSSYAERIGHSASTADPADSIDTTVLRWHDYFCKELPEELREAIRIEYLTGGKKSLKHADLGISARDYGPRLALAVETGRQMFTRSENMRKEVA